jgi:hypothetical protein
MKGCLEEVQLELGELKKLLDAVYARALSIQCWEISVGRTTCDVVVNEIQPLQRTGKDVSGIVHDIIQNYEQG